MFLYFGNNRFIYYFLFIFTKNLLFKEIIEKLLWRKIPLISDIYRYMQYYKFFDDGHNAKIKL